MNPPSPAAALAPRKILVVDDEPDIVAYLSAVLEDNGYEAIGVENAEDAMAALESRRPDLVLLDIMMPGHTGLSLYRDIRLRPEGKSLPILFISGYSKAEDFEYPGQGGLGGEDLPPPQGYLEKPISVPSLVSELGRLLDTGGMGG
jgi:CheY-like chemotaxis protein